MREKAQILDILNELDIASKYINMTLDNADSQDANPLDEFYKMIKINLQYLDSST